MNRREKNTGVSGDGADSESSLSSDPWARSISLLSQRQYASAVALLEEVVRSECSPALQALLGTALFLAERYQDAKQRFELALRADPQNTEWQNKLMLAAANAVSNAENRFPPVEAFDRDALLAPPILKPGAIPAGASAPRVPRPFAPVVAQIEKVSGAVVTAFMDAASFLAGKLGTSDGVWTLERSQRLRALGHRGASPFEASPARVQRVEGSVFR
jgi:tetratricopeptide (TPR) repeat protein